MRSLRYTNSLAFLIPLLSLAQTDSRGRPPLEVSLRRAVELATSTEGNTELHISREGIRQAQARFVQARAFLLPSFDAVVGEQNVKRNLAALGVPASWAGLPIPQGAGPFNIFDARITASQKILDFSSFRRVEVSRAAIGVAQYEERSVRQQVATRVAKDYLYALRAQADLEAIRADLLLARATLTQAVHQNASGTGMGIEVVRAQVDVANQCQRLLVAQSEGRRAQLRLLYDLGASLQTPIELTGKLTFTRLDANALKQGSQEALSSRADLQLQKEREENARLSARAIGAERLPSLAVLADYGPTGVGLASALPTHTFGVTLEIPLLDGGRRGARRAEAESQWRQERARTRDMNERADLEVRLALESLNSAESQMRVAAQGLELTQKELAQAQRRYQAGVTSGLEVTEAQTRLERARRNHLDAVFDYNQASIDFGAATGTLERVIETLDSTETEAFLVAKPAEIGVTAETACSGTPAISEENASVAAPQPGAFETPEEKTPLPTEPAGLWRAQLPAEAPGPALETIQAESRALSSAAPEPSYAVQLGAFKDRESAERFQRDMKVTYGAGCLLLGEGPSPLWRVLIGFGPDAARAKSLARRLGEAATPAFVIMLSSGTSCR